MTEPELGTIYFHTDYDGVVSAAMLVAWRRSRLSLIGVDYEMKRKWSNAHLEPHSAVVDFLYHPEAAIWFDHHSMPFVDARWRSRYRPDMYHRWAPRALACPPIIAESLGFADLATRHFIEYIRWSEIIDGARYESAEQAHDLTNPHIVLSRAIDSLRQPSALASLVNLIAYESVESVLRAPMFQPVVQSVLEVERRTQQLMAPKVVYDGRVAFLDQSDMSGSYRRYLPYLFYPEARFVVGIYRQGRSFNVSVGTNPWRPVPLLDVGELCQKWGGGGHQKVGGITLETHEEALRVANAIRDELAELDGPESFRTPCPTKSIKSGALM